MLNTDLISQSNVSHYGGPEVYEKPHYAMYRATMTTEEKTGKLAKGVLGNRKYINQRSPQHNLRKDESEVLSSIKPSADKDRSFLLDSPRETSTQNKTLQEFNEEENIFKKEPDLNETEATIMIKLEDLLLESASEMRVDTSSWVKSASNHPLSRSSRNTANGVSRYESEQAFPITSSTPTGSFVNMIMTTNKDLPQTVEESST